MIFNRVLPQMAINVPNSLPPPQKKGENLQEALACE